MRKTLLLFATLSDEDVDWLSEQGTVRRVAAGDQVIAEGERLQTFFLILSGRYSVEVSHEFNEDDVALEVGEVLGEMSLVDGSPASTGVAAREDGALLCVDIEKLRAKLKEDVGFAARFYHGCAIVLSTRLRDTVAILQEVEDGAELQLVDDIDPGDGSMSTADRARTRLQRLTALLE